MSDRIAVMHAGKVEQLGHARGALRAADDAGSWPTSSARPTCSRPVEPDGGVRLSSATSRASPHDGLATGQEVEISVRPEAIGIGPDGADGADAHPWRPSNRPPISARRSVSASHGRRTGPDRAGTQGRRPGSRSAAMSPSLGHRPRPSSSALARHGRRRIRMTQRPRRIEHRPRASARPVHGRAPASRGGAARADRRRSAPSPRWRRSSPPARRGRVGARQSSRPQPRLGAAPRPPRRRRHHRDRRADAGADARERAEHLQLGRLHRRDDLAGLREEVRHQGQLRQVPGRRRRRSPRSGATARAAATT